MVRPTRKREKEPRAPYRGRVLNRRRGEALLLKDLSTEGVRKKVTNIKKNRGDEKKKKKAVPRIFHKRRGENLFGGHCDVYKRPRCMKSTRRVFPRTWGRGTACVSEEKRGISAVI